MINTKIVNQVKNLINNNKWASILKLLEKRKLDPLIDIINGQTIAHMAAKNNNSKVIKYILDNMPVALEKINSEGDTSIHILAKNAYNKLIKEVLTKIPKLVNLLNNDHNTVLQLIDPLDDIYSWILDNYNKIINFDNINNKGSTVFLQNIDLTKDKKDKYFENIKKIIKFGDVNIPKNNPPLTHAIQNKKDYVAKELLKQKNINVNIQNDGQMTPLLLAVYNKMYATVKKLLHKNADIDYIGNDGDTNPMSLMIVRNDDKMLDIFFDHGFNINQFDRYMETPLHQAFSLKKELPPHLVAKLLYYGDLNIQNVNGDTPFHLFLEKYNWKDYDQILKKKPLDIFVKNADGNAPLNYVKNKSIGKFIDFVANNYIDKLHNIEL